MTQQCIIDAARDFRRNYIAPRAQSWENARIQPEDALREAAKLGLLSFETPREHGGMGASFRTKQAICEELARGDMAFAFSLVNTQNIAAKLAIGSTAQHHQDLVASLMRAEVFGATALSEPGAGSDFGGITTTAARSGEVWLLNGTKAWITNAAIADLFIVYAQTDAGSGWRGIASFLVDARKPGFRRGDIYSLLGGHSIGAGEFHLENYQASGQDLLSPPGEAFKHAMSTVNGARIYVASMCCGMVADALDRALDYGETRMAFGQSILENQGLTWSLCDVATDLQAMRALAEKAGQLVDDSGDVVLAAAVAKKFAGRVTLPAIAACMQAMGANGLRQDNALGRHLACAKIAAFTDGTTEMMNERIGVSIRRQRA
ncbi:MAG: acyl-CoA dehydrogenase family protein [Gammaproteobacteria bacterium]|jgi:alkylation response protein AidB-like acyl-CoA dehydrogenase|nr:acyl-CoA dehydrogenase family protein [Gammaproteobacteria bacterium]